MGVFMSRCHVDSGRAFPLANVPPAGCSRFRRDGHLFWNQRENVVFFRGYFWRDFRCIFRARRVGILLFVDKILEEKSFLLDLRD